jgi:rod shape-determining protein MreD
VRALVTVLTVYVLLALESPLLYQLSLSFYAPDLGLITILYLGMTWGTVPGVLAALAVGLLKDGFALGSPIGLYMHIAVVLFLGTRAIAAHLNLRPVVVSVFAAFVASLASSLLFLLLTLVFDRSFENYALIFRMMGPQALVTAPFAPILFLLFERVDRLTVRRRSGSIFFH